MVRKNRILITMKEEEESKAGAQVCCGGVGWSGVGWSGVRSVGQHVELSGKHDLMCVSQRARASQRGRESERERVGQILRGQRSVVAPAEEVPGDLVRHESDLTQ